MTDAPLRRILIAPQAFKGSLDGPGVAAAIAEGVRQGWPWPTLPQMDVVALADGGEGTVQALVSGAGPQGHLVPLEVQGPLLGQRVLAQWGWLDGPEPRAVIEMAQAAGLALVDPDARDPTQTTTYGVGELMCAALDHGAHTIAVGLGGSATNDGGAGMARALGLRLLDDAGAELPEGGAALARLDHIDARELDPRLQTVRIIGITDVTNPLNGPEGATAVYGPQKGATPEQIAGLDAALAHFAAVVQRDLGREIALVPGAGAAGGLGAGLLAVGGASVTLARGAEVILDTLEIDRRLASTDLVITGEGRLDDQIIFGKAPGVLAQRARARGVPVLCVVGGLSEGYARAYDLGVTAVVVATDGPRSLESSMHHAAELIADAVARALRLLAISSWEQRS